MGGRLLRSRDIEKIAAQMLCKLCDKIFKDPTTIAECLHMFCRKCITDKLIGDRMHQCPVCNVDLGANPLEKLNSLREHSTAHELLGAYTRSMLMAFHFDIILQKCRYKLIERIKFEHLRQFPDLYMNG